MSDYNLVCLVCGCGPHAKGTCTNCGTCETFLRADLQAARALTNINNLLVSNLPTMVRCLLDLVDLTCVIYPDAENLVNERRAKIKEELEKENAVASPTVTVREGDEPINTVGLSFPAGISPVETVTNTGAGLASSEAGPTEEDVS